MMKAAIVSLLLLLSATVHAADLSLFVGPRMSYFDAEFSWFYKNSPAAVDNWIVECGLRPGIYTEQSTLLPVAILTLPVQTVIPYDNKMHIWYCSVGAVEGGQIVVDSNEVVLQVRGKAVWLLSEGS